jgi:hypothetical protein
VQHLLHRYGILAEEALKNIPRSGPKNRLVKGDVLAWIDHERLSLKPVPSIQTSTPLEKSVTRPSASIADVPVLDRVSFHFKPVLGALRPNRAEDLQLIHDLLTLSKPTRTAPSRPHRDPDTMAQLL